MCSQVRSNHSVSISGFCQSPMGRLVSRVLAFWSSDAL